MIISQLSGINLQVNKTQDSGRHRGGGLCLYEYCLVLMCSQSGCKVITASRISDAQEWQLMLIMLISHLQLFLSMAIYLLLSVCANQTVVVCACLCLKCITELSQYSQGTSTVRLKGCVTVSYHKEASFVKKTAFSMLSLDELHLIILNQMTDLVFTNLLFWINKF